LTAGHIQGGYALFYDTPSAVGRPTVGGPRELAARLGAGLHRAQRAATHANRSLMDEPVPDTALAATYSVAANPRAVASARHFHSGTLAACGVRRGAWGVGRGAWGVGRGPG